MTKKYTITCNKTHLEVMNKALHTYFRLICGQFRTAFEEFWWDKELFNKLNSKQQLFITKIFDGFDLDEMWGRSEFSQIAFDLHQVIRHQLWKENENKKNFSVDANVTQLSSEDLIEFWICHPT